METKLNKDQIEIIRKLVEEACKGVEENVLNVVERTFENNGYTDETYSKEQQDMFNVVCNIIEEELDGLGSYSSYVQDRINDEWEYVVTTEA